jgi:hypothetical protein
MATDTKPVEVVADDRPSGLIERVVSAQVVWIGLVLIVLLIAFSVLNPDSKPERHAEPNPGVLEVALTITRL